MVGTRHSKRRRRGRFRTAATIVAAVAALGTAFGGTLSGTAYAYSASPSPSQYPIKGVDVTEYQHPNGAGVNWSQIHSSGVKFATLKATRGTNVVNPYFKGDLAGSLAQGIATAPYHFLIGYDPNTASAQADYFISALRSAGYTGHRPGELPPILTWSGPTTAPAHARRTRRSPRCRHGWTRCRPRSASNR